MQSTHNTTSGIVNVCSYTAFASLVCHLWLQHLVGAELWGTPALLRALKDELPLRPPVAATVEPSLPGAVVGCDSELAAEVAAEVAELMMRPPVMAAVVAEAESWFAH